VTEDEALAYAAASIRSVWALEMLLTLKRAPERVWTIDALIRELRSSLAVVNECLSNLRNAGLITEDGEGGYRYNPASPELGEMASALEKIHGIKPMAVIKAIVSGPSDKLRIFSDAFKFNKD
jgi:hypothetical protein